MNLSIYRRAFSGPALFFFFAWAATLGAQSKPPLAPVRPATDDYFGTQVTDPYRWMETSKGELLAYMKAQNVVTQEALAPFATQNTGHGIGSNRTQLLKLIADEYTFLGWQLVMSGFVAGTAAGK